MTTISASTADPSATKADAVVIAVATSAGKKNGPPRLLTGSERVDEALGGSLTKTLHALGASGRAGEVTQLASGGATKAPIVVAVGVGDGDPTPDALRRAAAVATRSLKGRATVVLALPTTDAATTAAVAEGALSGGYDFVDFRRTSLAGRKGAVGRLVVTVADRKSGKAAVERGRILAESATLVRDLVNTPPGDLPPATLAARATAAAKELGLSVEVLDEKALAKGAYGGILGVGRGSANPPRLTRIAYRPTGPGKQTAKHVALVGKGITFDSGGLSLKPPTSMETMKSDMAGAATVLGAVLAAARLELPVAVTAYLPSAENMPGGNATRPGDVLTMYGGKTVEVLNTDAEGRLVLGDALVRAGEDAPDAIVDIATLTGAQLVALGTRTAGLMANDDDFRTTVADCAAEAGEAVWPMPLPPELRDKIDSPIADLTNVGPLGSRDGGMLLAGHFLKEFVPEGVPWAHLDIAGPSYHGGEPYGYTAKGGTAFGLRTLVAVVESFA
ncbi:MAG TPA: leucyl aminopeptidase [Mycobacteriales bacterium]